MLLTEPQIVKLGMTGGVGSLVGYMLFIIYKLARESKAGKTGTAILFFVLAFGMLGFIAKSVLQFFFERTL